MKLLVITLIFCSFIVSAKATTLVSGKVLQENGEPVAGVNAYLEGTYDGSSSDGNGFFQFTTDETGEKTLKVVFMGFEPYTSGLILQGDTIYLDITLKEAFNELSAVTITAGTFEASDKKQAVTISPLDMVTTAGANGDVYGALQSLPGTTKNGESGRLFVKGGDSSESQTYIDGAWVPVPYNSSAPNVGTRGRYNPFLFKGMIFSTGGYSAEYGQALSSVLLLNTNDLPEEDQLDLSFLSVGPEIAGTKRWENGAVTATASWQNLSPYMSMVNQNYEWVHAPESASGALSLRQKTGKSGMFKFYSNMDKATFTLKQDDLNEVGSSFDYRLDNRNVFVNSSWKGMLTERLGMHAAASYTDNTDDIAYQQTSVDNSLKAFYLKDAFTYVFNDRFRLKTGGEWFSEKRERQVDVADGHSAGQLTKNTFAAFAEAQLYTSNRFVSRIGIRTEYDDLREDWNVAPRLSSAYKISDNTQVSGAWGWFYQSADDNYLMQSAGLKPERADHYTLTFLSSVNKRTLRAELYNKDYRDLVKYTVADNGDYTGFSNTGSGYARGVDLFWRDKQTVKGGDYWISYSFIDTKRDYRDYPYRSRPGFASKHNLSVVYKHWLASMRSLVGVNFNYSSPRVYNNPNTSVFNGEKMRAYRSLDISWSFLYRQNIILYGAVTNLPGFKNEYGRNYAELPDSAGFYNSSAIQPSSTRFFVLACFITLTRRGTANQLDKIE